jgi:Domain of unknown function (DUF4375)
MSLVDWRRRQDRIEEIFVPESAVADEDDPRNLATHVLNCVKHAVYTGMYRRDELPRDALIVATLVEYLGMVDNGGHAQFVHSVCWCEEHSSDVREGLEMLGLDEAARIFSDLETFAKRHPRRFARNKGQAQDPYFDELDRRFYGPIEDSIDAALPEWIKTRPWLRTMPNEEYYRIRGWETPHHTLREARFEERRRATEPELRRGLLALQAAGRSRQAKGWKRWWWRLLQAWYSRGL